MQGGRRMGLLFYGYLAALLFITLMLGGLVSISADILSGKNK